MGDALQPDRREQQWWCEAASFPLLSVRAIYHGINQLEFANRFPAGLTKTKLADAFDNAMIQEYRLTGISLENIRLIRNFAWFGALPVGRETGVLPLHDYLFSLTRSLFLRQGNDIVLQSPPAIGENPCGKIADVARGDSLFYHRLTLRLPPDLVWAAFRAAETPASRPIPGEAPDRIRIRVGHNQLETVQFTDQHMHLWACIPFDLLWCGMLTRKTLSQSGKSENFEILRPGWRLNMRPLYLAAWTTRLLLRRFLDTPDDGTNFETFADGLRNRGCHLPIATPGAAHGLWTDALEIARTASSAQTGFTLWGQKSDSWLRGCREFEYFSFRSGRGHIDPLDNDSSDGLPRSIERQLLFDAMRYLARNPSDTGFARNFWNYVRCRNLYYSTLVQQEGVGGLNYFDGFYRKISLPRRANRKFNRHRLELGVKRIQQTSRVAKLEFRIAPESTAADWRRIIQQDLGGYRRLLRSTSESHPAPAIGFSIHFTKAWGNRRKWEIEGSPKSPTYPNSYPVRGCQETHSQIRYQGHLYDCWKQLTILLGLFREEPNLRFFYHGLDIANRERTVPNWVFSPIFLEFRKQLQTLRSENLSGDSQCATRQTAHAGEEFAHPVSGLRRIFEAVRFCGMEPGDRIGHGVALGLDLEDWARNHTRVLIPVGEYLEDLCWETFFYRMEDPENSALRLEAARDNLHEFVTRVRNRFSDIHDRLDCKKHKNIIELLRSNTYYESYLLQFRDADENHGYGLWGELGVMRRDSTGGWHVMRDSGNTAPQIGMESSHAERLLAARVGCEKYWQFEQSLGAVAIPVNDEYLQRTGELQQRMRRWIANGGVTIETCPSSNRLIGDMSAYRCHPVTQLHPPDTTGNNHVGISINADDPLTFNTTVAEEYSHLRLGHARNGVSALQLEQWLENIARNAWNTSFVWPSDTPYPNWPDRNRILRKLDEINRRGRFRLS